MKKFSRIFGYLGDQKKDVVFYFITNFLAIVFSTFSLVSVAPVLKILFTADKETVKGDGLLAKAQQFVTDLILQYQPMRALILVVSVIIIATLLKNLFLYLSRYILMPIRNNVLRRLRNDLFLKTISLPIGFFTEERKGDLISRMTNDINEVELSIMATLEVFIREPLTIIFTLASMIIISPQLTVFLVLFLPVIGLIISIIGKSLKRRSTLAQEQLGDMLGVLDETLGGLRILKAFNAEKQQYGKFSRINDLIYRTRNQISLRQELGSPLSETVGVIAVGVILWYGGTLIFSGQTTMTGEWFIGYIILFTQIINPLKNLSNSFLNIKKGSAALERIEHLLNATNVVKEAEHPRQINDFESTVHFKNVSFHYGDREILNDINITIEKGKTIALVGASGAGKSTLVDLVPRFHDVGGGILLIDGIDIKEYKIDDLRKLMGIVSQEPILFNDTIYNNITLGTEGATQAQVEEAARIANAHNFILQKPEGYQTIVGDRGTKLSGGERQRITIARAVLKNPPILILDEATSSLDTESERLVQNAINTLMKNRTCIVIAHRLSTVQHADEIIVMQSGKIMERGTHDELMQKSGHYRKLVDMQQVR
ncbi:MAG TPA: ABC transporter ATP-binding protein [Flavipsychrobacter sp.]|nr:ABC transporter ATP-binding protein [Flavipsychrobacter sp.]